MAINAPMASYRGKKKPVKKVIKKLVSKPVKKAKAVNSRKK